MQRNKNQKYVLFFIIAIGLFLRLVWVSDMEWKDDEQWMYKKAHEAAAAGQLPAAGMRSGGGIVNPGMSIGVFAFIAKFTDDPLEMNRVVQVLNIFSVLGFLLFVFLKVKGDEREIWLLGITLAAISPLAVLFSRKIWAQDLLPGLSFLIILANSYRNKGWGAFVWGLAGALIGQVHMSGFFFAAGLFVFTVLHDYYNKIKFRWICWIAGSIIGSISIIPWIQFMLDNPQLSHQSFWHIFQFNFYLCWFFDSQGLNVMYSMRKEFWQFIKEPVIAGIPTYLVAVAHLFLAAASIFTLMALWKYMKRAIRFLKDKIPFKNIFLNMSITRFYLFSVLLGLGVFMTLSGTTIYTHYLICAFPFSYIFLAKVLEHRKRLMFAIIFAQLFVTILFLFYVHNHNGIEKGDYGKVYRVQVK